MSETADLSNGNKNPPIIGDLGLKRKKSHDLAYLLIILAVLFGTFLFVMVIVNSMLRNIGF
jgi:hypothetical protein